jgi:lipoprotein-releasing system permease protein
MTALTAESAIDKPPRRGVRPFSRFEWMVAFRYLRARRRETFISVISIISLIGIGLGVATLIIVLAVMNGFRAELIDKILGLNGHFIVQPIGAPLTDYDAVAQRLAMVDGVVGVVPLIEGQVLASGPAGSGGALVRGVREQDIPGIPGLASNVKAGTLDGFDAAGGVAIGAGVASSLGIAVGDSITLIAPEGDVTPFGVVPRQKAYPVIAIFEIGMTEYDSTFVFMPLAEAQLYFNLPGEASAIELYVEDPDAVDRMRPAVEDAMGRGLFLVFILCDGLIGVGVQLVVDGNDVAYAIAAASGIVHRKSTRSGCEKTGAGRLPSA